MSNEYQAAAATTAVYPNVGTGDATALSYVTMGLTGEAGEIANKVKKVLRDDNGQVLPYKREELIGELGDVLWYCAMLASELGVSLEMVMDRNVKKLKARQERNKLQGSGDNR